MADLNQIRAALATQITAHTGLRALADARDSVNPPCAIVLPGQPLIKYGDTVEGPGMFGAVTINLVVLVVISDAPPSEQVQRALDAYLGVGSGESASIAGAIVADSTLGGTVHYCEALTVSNYGILDYSGISYFGARVNCQAGAI